MKSIGFLPLRKGSKGIPGKNKKKLLGRPLFCWVLGEAIASTLDSIYVYTDDDDIISFCKREYHWTDKVQTVKRSEASATDTASTEMGMQEFVKGLDASFDILCLLQATSPFTTAIYINACIDKVSNDENYDSALTVVNTHRFTWNADGTPKNYDVFNRPRRQDFDGLLIENGACYVTTSKAFRKSGNRISGNIATVQMPEDSLTEIDTLTDWKIVEELLASRLKTNKGASRISHLILDVDGVFTDGCIYYGSEGELMKKFDMRDGMGLEIIRQHNVEVMVMTSEDSQIVASRMKKLKIKDVFLGVKDKYSLLSRIATDRGISFSEMAYIGDDVNDLANICAVGWSLTPANATMPIKNHADIILQNNSAEGAIREACDFIFKYNNRYE
ncbi:acylneuraminate cytidylyltransferase [Dokdonia sinensis]|uniref:N-acylneuraminate cytidylyltransferase n=1 Tax=Dokdonia sinensis TaxID=2479847 RepID=A0A3M0G8P4_9FLAO|nr:acylneuraminate cytidylyltransferase [Dokdonia sinensis]RMB57419.1 acylneuraminate cytidylyltransferase [Dokdonia sinensis]